MPSSRGGRRATALAATAAALSWVAASPLKEAFLSSGPPSIGLRLGAPASTPALVEPPSSAPLLGSTGATSCRLATTAATALAAAATAVAAARRRGAKGRGAVAVAACHGDVSADVGASPVPAGMCFSGAAGMESLGPVFGGAAARTTGGNVSMNLLMPKNITWKKPHKPAIKPFRHCTKWRYRGEASKGNKPCFGKYALAIKEECWISNKCIEVCRRTMTRVMERKGKIWIRVFPHQAITKRVLESRMGAGKGGIDRWVQAVRPGCILFEMDGVSEAIAKEAFRKCHYKLPGKTQMLIKQDGPSRFELGLAGKIKVRGGDPRQYANFKKG